LLNFINPEETIIIFDGISFCKKNEKIQRIVHAEAFVVNHPEKIVSVSNVEHERMKNYNFSQQLPVIEKTN